ncbi:MAG: methionyl-tRNA formyltransferase [Patescibacteria group bacterium]
MNKSPNQIIIVFLGTPAFAATILEVLVNSPYRPSLVITEPDKFVGRQQQLTPSAVKLMAERHNLPVVQPASAAELQATLEQAGADLGIVAAYGRILTGQMLASARQGFLNVHASLLPAHRGATPIQAAILAGDPETGVTIMQINEGLDTGPIVSWAPLAIEETATAEDLTELLAELGGQLLIETLPDYLDCSIVSQAQPATTTPVSKRLTRESGQLTGQEKPEQVLRMLRAYHPWPGVWLEIEAQRVILFAAHLKDCRLVPDQLQLAGKNPVDWLTFHRDRPELAKKIIEFFKN